MKAHNLKKMTILRNLLAKGVFEEVDQVEATVIMELSDELLERGASDKIFGIKYGQWLITISKFLKQNLRGSKFPRKFSKGAMLQFNMLQPFLPSKRAYLGLKKKLLRSFSLIIRNSQSLPSRKFEKRVIGVGYRDKGTLPDKSFDGSPHYKEVAKADENFLETQVLRQKQESKERKKNIENELRVTRSKLIKETINKAKTFNEIKSAALLFQDAYSKNRNQSLEEQKLLNDLKDKLNYRL
jgi:hypothetical protein